MTIRRYVTKSRKDTDGDITALCNSNEAWSPRLKSGAIQDIESGSYEYYTYVSGTNPAKIHVVSYGGRKYLRSTADADDANNLDNLPDC